MKLSLTQENLSRALNTVGRIVGSRTTLPVLANVLLTTDNKRLKLSTTNLEMGINYWVGAKVEKDGAITVPARLLAEYVTNLPKGTLELSVDKNLLSLTTEHYESHINGIDAEEFPTIPVIDKKANLELPAQDFKAALAQVVLVASNDDARPVLNGVYFKTEGSELLLVATDSYRLAEKKLKLTKSAAQPLNIIIPARSVAELLRMIDDDTETISLTVDENQVLFRFSDIELVSRLIDGQFPDYKQLIPNDSQMVATLDTEEFNTVAKVASLFARESASSVTVASSVKDSQLSLKSIASQVGDNVSTATAKIEGDDAEIALNSRYILDALGVVNASQITFAVTGKINPCLIRPVDNDDYLHIIMPLRS